MSTDIVEVCNNPSCNQKVGKDHGHASDRFSGMCEYEDCDQEVTVLLAGKPDEPQGMCKFHAMASLCFHASTDEVRKALIEADKYPDIVAGAHHHE